MTRSAVLAALVAAARRGRRGVIGCQARRKQAAAPTTLRIGFFPNLTHGAALVALSAATSPRRWRRSRVDAKPFNAGPEAMEALFAGALDACYVGPAPAINGYLRSHGEALVIVAGAALRTAPAWSCARTRTSTAPADLHGKKLATPQLGNTQDVALRIYLRRRTGSRRRTAAATCR